VAWRTVPPLLPENVRQVGRKRAVKGHLQAGDRVGQLEVCCVESEPGRQRQGVVAVAVDRVAEHRMPEVGEVNADLVGAAGAELRLNEREDAVPLEGADEGQRRPSAGALDQRGATGAGTRPADIAIDALVVSQVARRQGEVAPGHKVGLELVVKMLRGLVRQRQNHQARCVQVEAMDHEHSAVSSRHGLDRGAGSAQHGVLLTGHRGMDDEPCRLVDDKDVLVQVDHDDRLGTGASHEAAQVRSVLDLVGVGHDGTGVGDHIAVDGDVTDLDLVASTGVARAQQGLHSSGEAALLIRHGSHGSAARRRRETGVSGVASRRTVDKGRRGR
jgi:hypothetical protein